MARKISIGVLAVLLVVAPAPVVRADDAALGGDGSASSAAAADPSLPSESLRQRVVEEIVVTANRRTQNLQEVVGSITALSGEDLEKVGAAGFEDYVFKIPGIDVSDDGASKKISVRGISNMATYGFGAATASPVGIYLDDVPIQGDGVLPDLDLYDMQRIEVLKGPQGTLYGEGAQGGAFKMVLNRADPTEFFAKGEAGIGKTKAAGDLTHFQKLALNVPLTESWAIRLVGSRRFDAGFVDYFNIPDRDANDITNSMGRLHVDGEIWEGFTVSGMFFHQRQRVDQFPQVQFENGDLRNDDFEPQFNDTNVTLGSLTLDYDFGFATLTSSTGVLVNDREALLRTSTVGAIYTNTLRPYLDPPPDPPTELEREFAETMLEQFGVTQELRLVSNGEGAIDWVAGFYFRTRERNQNILVNDSEAEDTPPPLGPGNSFVAAEESFQQLALFGEATLHLPWNLQLGVGLRGFRETVKLGGFVDFRGYLYPFAVADGRPDGRYSGKSYQADTLEFTPKVSLSWFADESRMLYAQAANGIRSGGTNTRVLWDSTNNAPLFKPDSLWAYEIGAKTQWLGDLLTLNAALFYNDWTDLQVVSSVPTELAGLPSSDARILNAGEAYTQGFELEASALPLDDLSIGFNLTLMSGRIVKGDEQGIVADNSVVPQLAEISYAALANYTFSRWPLFGFVPSIGFDMQSTSNRSQTTKGAFTPSGELEGFRLFNGFFALSGERWDASFTVRNITDERNQLGVNAFEEETVTIGRPRSLLARVGFRF